MNQQLCAHPSEKVRKAVVDGIRGLLSFCRISLSCSKLLLLVSKRTLSYHLIIWSEELHNCFSGFSVAITGMFMCAGM